MRDWRNRAACRDEDSELFFPAGVGTQFALQIEQAKQVCRGCPVRGECLEFALQQPERFGIFGGMTAEERANLRRRARRANAA